MSINLWNVGLLLILIFILQVKSHSNLKQPNVTNLLPLKSFVIGNIYWLKRNLEKGWKDKNIIK